MPRTIAISVLSQDGLAAKLDPRFGRAAYFLIAVEESGDWQVKEIYDNAAKDDAHGAGGAAAAHLSRLGVDGVISGRFGPKAYQALEVLQIKMWLADEGVTARDALAAFSENRLKEMIVAVY